MAIATSNRLLPLLAGAVVLMLAFVTLKSCTGEPDDALVLETVPQAPAPDADSPADTIKTLTANVAAMTAEVQALRKDNDQLRKENQRPAGQPSPDRGERHDPASSGSCSPGRRIRTRATASMPVCSRP